MDQSHTDMSSKIEPIEKALECPSWQKVLEEFPILGKLLKEKKQKPEPFMITETYNQEGRLVYKRDPSVYHKA